VNTSVKPSDPPPLKVAIVCDRSEPARGRPCRWLAAIEQLDRADLAPRTVAVSEEMRTSNPALTLFDRDATDVLILNWNVLNGDPVYDADRTLAFFQHYASDLEHWLATGGILILEAQTAASRLQQQSYDVVSAHGAFPLRVHRSVHTFRGRTVYLDRRLYRRHPALDYPPHVKRTSLAATALGRSWAGDVSPPPIESLARADSNRSGLHNGWFTRRGRGWRSIAYAPQTALLSPRRRVVAVARTVADDRRGTAGMVVATTMYLTRPEVSAFLAAILGLGITPADYHYSLRLAQRRATLGHVLAAVLGLGVFTALAVTATATVVSVGTAVLAGLVVEVSSYFYRRDT
jgi:hypothetical protein